MLCEKPYIIGTVPCPCAKCFPCRVNRRRIWAHRMLLESMVSSDSSFVTLTYDDAYLPDRAVLEPKHVQDWLKRIRKLVAPQRLRFFAVGEYGEQTQRPHYHVALFGIHPWLAGGVSGQSGFVARTWSYGFSYVGELNADSAMYVAGYCTKKMMSRKDPRLYGKSPEFARMSLRPGIGASAMRDIATVLTSKDGVSLLHRDQDVPYSLQHGRRLLPLGRYLRGVLREKCGFGSRETPVEAYKKYAYSMRFLRESSLAAAKDKTLWNWSSPGKLWADSVGQKVRNLKARTAVYSKEKML